MFKCKVDVCIYLAFVYSMCIYDYVICENFYANTFFF